MLTLGYSVSDGTGSCVASFTPTMDGATTLTGVPNLQSGTPIALLTTLGLGSHTFKVASTDNLKCATANNIYKSSINAVLAQRGKGITVTAANIMIADAQYLIAHCP